MLVCGLTLAGKEREGQTMQVSSFVLFLRERGPT